MSNFGLWSAADAELRAQLPAPAPESEGKKERLETRGSVDEVAVAYQNIRSEDEACDQLRHRDGADPPADDLPERHHVRRPVRVRDARAVAAQRDAELILIRAALALPPDEVFAGAVERRRFAILLHTTLM